MKVNFIRETEEHSNFTFNIDLKNFIEIPWFLESMINEDIYKIDLILQILKKNISNFKVDWCRSINFRVSNVLKCEITHEDSTYFSISIYNDAVFINIYPRDITRDFVRDIESILIDNKVTFSEVVIESHKVGFKNIHFTDYEEGLCIENENVQETVDNENGLELSLVPSQVILDMAEVIGFENRKYGDVDNRKTIDVKKHNDAAYRHLLAYIEDPSSLDEESGIENYKHLASDLAFICHIMGNRKEL